MPTIFESHLDMIIFFGSCLVLLIYCIKYFQQNNNNSDDEDGNGDGGQLNPANDPVLDLPPGVSLPTDAPEPEMV